ncbi:MAG: hypothetical protein ACREBU_17480, partial [Nitrososphaera sp.]
MKTRFLVVLIGFVLMSSGMNFESSHAASEGDYAVVSGYLNIREIVYVDGSISHDYIVMNDDNGTHSRYLLQFDDEQQQDDLISGTEDWV